MAEATPPFRARQRALSYPDDEVEQRKARLLLVPFGLERELVERLASIGFVTLDHCCLVTLVVARRRVRVPLKGEYLSGHER